MNMKYFLAGASVLLVLFWALPTQAQGSLEDFNTRRLELSKNGAMVLGTWAIGNIAFSGARLKFGEPLGDTRYALQMNMYWNVVNLALAAPWYFRTIGSDPASFDLLATLREQRKMEKLLLFNAGLDVGYMAAGLWLIERSKRGGSREEMLSGFGRSVIIQGAFLFVFDLLTYAALNGHSKTLLPVLMLGPTENGLGMVFRF